MTVAKSLGLLAVIVLAAGWYYFGPQAGSPAGAAPASPASHTDSGRTPEPTQSPATPPRTPDAPIAPAHPTAAAPTSSGEIRIGSWNIEWLGKPEDRSGAGKNVAQDPADLADCIIASKVAALGVCEIVASDSGRPIHSRAIEQTLEVMKKRTGDSWEYVLFPGRSDGDQLTGVLWNTGVLTAETAEDKPFDPKSDLPWPVPVGKGRSSQGSGLWNRPPHAMKFSTGKGKTDFVMIVLHMKADYNGDFSQHRKEEADALAGALPAVRKKFHDEDILLLGDTNCTGEHEPAIAALEKAGFVDLNSAHKATHWRGGTMDRELVPIGQPEFADAIKGGPGHGFEVMSDTYLRQRSIDAREYKRRYSDHFMVVSTIRIMPDDD